MIVSNSTPLIWLAKIGKLELLKKFFKTVMIPEAVYDEVVTKEIEAKAHDAFIVENAVKEGCIKIRKVKGIRKLEKFGLHKGEANAISLAGELKSEILVDETHARLAAKALNIKPYGTIYILIRALKEDIINYDEYIDLLRGLVKSGFRMSDELYLEAVKIGREL
ncbi:MAG: DUF3368 domain-containing protein [Euryarchaeota archaeon CG01_land_8_20_14_3_00_38_12]|nr:MAG: DUF3368 domain-containing protein [Euryarchaeota archaeon CG01_land_8_20_14_3_00_38_12]PJB22006.1 MAG: DUF3368 domain-containing protein [Euryarchaeota archaeon CG_4_9_14_3_um_filter_38_12]